RRTVEPGRDPQVELPRIGSAFGNAEREVGRVEWPTRVVLELGRRAAVAAALFPVAALAGEFPIELSPSGNERLSRARPWRNADRSWRRPSLEVARASLPRPGELFHGCDETVPVVCRQCCERRHSRPGNSAGDRAEPVAV